MNETERLRIALRDALGMIALLIDAMPAGVTMPNGLDAVYDAGSAALAGSG